MNHVLARMTDKYAETIAALRAKLAHALPDHANAYRAEYVTVSVPAPDVARAADQLAEAARTIQQGIERERRLSERITRLESSNGSLMVDRDRGIRQAHDRMAGAQRVAADALAALRDAGIEPGADLDTLVTDAIRHYDTTLYRLDAEGRRLDEFRCSMVGLIDQFQRHSSAGNGLTSDQVAKLGRAIERANNKACGR